MDGLSGKTNKEHNIIFCLDLTRPHKVLIRNGPARSTPQLKKGGDGVTLALGRLAIC